MGLPFYAARPEARERSSHSSPKQQKPISGRGLAGGICRCWGHLAMGRYLRVIGGKAQHRQQEESDEDDDNQERLSLLRGPSSQAGGITFHVIEPPFSLPQSCAWLELL